MSRCVRHDNNFIAVHIELFDCLTKDLLTETLRVDVRCVEGVDAMVIGVLDLLERLLFVEHPTLPVRCPVGHAAQDDLSQSYEYSDLVLPPAIAYTLETFSPDLPRRTGAALNA